MEELSSLIGQIYDAVVDPDRWMVVLGLIADFIDSARATLILENAAQPLRSVAYQSYFDPDWTQSYMQTYMLINPMRIAMIGRVVAGDVVLTTDFMSKRE